MITPETFDELVGAFALDAIDADEAAAIEEFLAAYPERAREVERLRAAAAWYGASQTETPPPALREAIMRRAQARSSGNASGSVPAVDAHDAAAQLLRDVAHRVDDTAAHLVTVNGLDVHDLVAHLAAMESLVAEWAGQPTLPELTGQDFEDRTAEAVARFEGVPLAEVLDEWERAAGVVRAAGTRAEPLRWFGSSRPASDVLTFRAFETWTHAGDIAVALGAPRPSLPGHAFATMATAAMGLMQHCLAARGAARPGQSARLVLTGPGGGDFVIPLAPGEEPAAQPSVTIQASVFDWCVRVADRCEPGAMTVSFDGDEALGRELVAAASAFATL
jgi:uncharacterized protein (TIGR03083 family)